MLGPQNQTAPIQPYIFIADDWNWMIWLAGANASFPALVYLPFAFWITGSQMRLDVLQRISMVHAVVWSPVVLLGIVTSFEILHSVAAVWL